MVRQPSEFKVKRYFYNFLEEVRKLQSTLVDLSEHLSSEDSINLEAAALRLVRHYNDICFPGAISSERRLIELEEAAKILTGVAQSLKNATKQANRLSRQISCKRSRTLSKNLWYR